MTISIIYSIPFLSILIVRIHSREHSSRGISLAKRLKILPLLFKCDRFLLFWNEIYSKGMKSQSLFWSIILWLDGESHSKKGEIDSLLWKKNSEKVILVQEWQIFTLLKWDLLFRNEIHSEGVNLTLKEWKSATLEQEWLFHYFFQVWSNFQSLPMRLHEIQRVLFAIVAKLLYVSQFYISIYFKLHFRFLTLSRKIYYLCLKFYSFFKIFKIIDKNRARCLLFTVYSSSFISISLSLFFMRIQYDI